jgi:hypothetical protein
MPVVVLRWAKSVDSSAAAIASMEGGAGGPTTMSFRLRLPRRLRPVSDPTPIPHGRDGSYAVTPIPHGRGGSYAVTPIPHGRGCSYGVTPIHQGWGGSYVVDCWPCRFCAGKQHISTW